MFPVRFSVVTYNIWNDERWPERAPALRTFCEIHRPDVLCVQELVPETRGFLDEVLAGHARVNDDFEGWAYESNIWWRSDLFLEVQHGAEDFGIEGHTGGEFDSSRRRLFWVRLRPADTDRTLVISTVHLTDQGAPEEQRTGQSPRIRETEGVIAGLTRVVGPDEPALLMGDFNDSLFPLGRLFAAGYRSSFGALAEIPPPTMPTELSRFGTSGFSTCFVLDWIVANEHARVLSTSSPHLFVEGVPPSDHWPVHAVYEI
jgi:endonuclease/exonuclease/phosphatase family metal-dependent hydrolase